jgi:hypothetical protein
MVANLTMIRFDADRKQLANILDADSYHLQHHNHEALLLVLHRRPDSRQELLLDLYLSHYRYTYNG